jgi:hypothetical protein
LLDRCVNLRYRSFRAIVTLLSSVIEFSSVFKQSDLVKLFFVPPPPLSPPEFHMRHTVFLIELGFAIEIHVS